MSCCRGNRRVVVNEGPFCSALEAGGASFRVWPVQTRNGYKLVTSAIINGSQIKLDFIDYLKTHRCQSSTAVWVFGELRLIENFLASKPSALSGFLSSGLTLAELARLSRSQR